MSVADSRVSRSLHFPVTDLASSSTRDFCLPVNPYNYDRIGKKMIQRGNFFFFFLNIVGDNWNNENHRDN